MPKLEFVAVKTKIKKKYNFDDTFKFSLTFKTEKVEEIEICVYYFGDACSEKHDQILTNVLVGPFEEGEQFFEIETDKIDLTKIPIKSLFGITTILISAKYKGNQFLRIGYVVNVRYPGIKTECLTDENNEEESDELEVNSEGEIEIMNDDELEEENKEENLIKEEENLIKEEETPIKEENLIKEVETPIKEDEDEFEYKGYKLSKSKIEFVLLEKPIIHTFDLDDKNTDEGENEGENNSENEGENNSENEGENEDENNKKVKVE